MFVIDRLILLAAILLIVGVLSSKLSTRMGLPVLVVFLWWACQQDLKASGGSIWRTTTFPPSM